MAAWRRAIELSLGDADVERLRSIAQSRTEPASRVERARILLAYREDPSFFAVGQALGLHHQTVQRCVERAVVEGPMAALDDRPRPGKEPVITIEAKAWLTSLACRKAKELGYPHELWTTRLLARHAREHGPAEGHACLASLAQGTVCKILDQEEVKPHKVRYYLEQRDPEFSEKMAEVLCVYRRVKLLKKVAVASKKKPSDAVAIISYDEKPGIQAIATTSPDLPMWTPVEPAGTALIIRARSSMGPRTRGRPEPAMSVARSAAEVLRDHVVLEVEAIDRMYLNVYVPHLQSVGAVVGYLRVHRGQRFASTTAVTPMTEAFVRNIDQFVNDEGVDLVAFQKGQRKDDVTQKYVRKFTRREGVLYVGKAQEKARVMRTERRCSRFTGGTYP